MFIYKQSGNVQSMKYLIGFQADVGFLSLMHAYHALSFQSICTLICLAMGGFVSTKSCCIVLLCWALPVPYGIGPMGKQFPLPGVFFMTIWTSQHRSFPFALLCWIGINMLEWPL